MPNKNSAQWIPENIQQNNLSTSLQKQRPSTCRLHSWSTLLKKPMKTYPMGTLLSQLRVQSLRSKTPQCTLCTKFDQLKPQKYPLNSLCMLKMRKQLCRCRPRSSHTQMRTRPSMSLPRMRLSRL